MTILEKLKQDHPELGEFELGLTVGTKCPNEFGYCEEDSWHCNFTFECCKECWNQPFMGCVADKDIPKEDSKYECITKETIDAALEQAREWAKDAPKVIVEIPELAEPTIKDSGDRTEFATGAVRDMREGKGRCDLMPLEVVANYLCEDYDKTDWVLQQIREFQKTHSTHYLYSALLSFNEKCWNNHCTMFLEVAKHFEEGAKKYGESNWQKGIPVHCYIDSAVRHYLKWARGDKDEPHDRAFVWNVMCCIWEVDYHKTTVEEVREES